MTSGIDSVVIKEVKKATSNAAYEKFFITYEKQRQIKKAFSKKIKD